jgi:hypothetical protein
MLALVLAAVAASQAPQDTATLDVPVYVDAVHRVSLPRPYDDWVFEPGTAQRTTTVIFHPRDEPLSAQLWGALVLTGFSSPVSLARVADQRVESAWRQLLGRRFVVLGRDSLTLAGLPAVHLRMTGTIGRVRVGIEEYVAARDSDLVLLQLRYPEADRDSAWRGYQRVVNGLGIGHGVSSAPEPVVAASFADSVAAERVLPRSGWQVAGYDALVRYDTVGPRADFVVRMEIVNDGADSADSVPVWLWPGFALDSVRGGSPVSGAPSSASVSWVRLVRAGEPRSRAVLTCFYHLQPRAAALPPGLMGMSPEGAFAVGEWLPRTQPALDSGGQRAQAARPRLTLRFDLPRTWRAVAQGRLVSEELFLGRRRMTWRTDEIATAVAAFALGPYRVTTGYPGAVPVSLWLEPGDSLLSAAADSLAAAVGAAWIFCSRAFGPLPIGEVAVATAGVPAPRGFAGLVLLDRRTAGLFAAVDSSGAVPPQATDAVFREVARTWWGNSVAAAGAGSAWIEESFPAWAALAARGVLQGDSVRQRLVAEVEAGWRAASAGAGDLALSAIVPGGPRADLLRTKGVAAIEAMRRALGEARFREALLSLTREHRGSWLTLDTVLAAAGPDVSTVLRSFLYQYQH